MKYISLFSGIEAASCAWSRIDGWKPIAFSEIEKFPCSVLKHHFPDVTNMGDITKINRQTIEEVTDGQAIDLVVGGSPCQDLSVAGKRAGIHGERSGLAFEYLRLLSIIRPEWVLWENVPGVLSSNQGRDFKELLKTFNDAGYGCAWRVLDAQWFGVAQRRRRVFLVGHLGDWRPSAAVLFERQGLSGNSKTSKTEGEETSRTTQENFRGSVSNCLTPWAEQSRRVLTTNGRSDTLADGSKVFAPGGIIFQCFGEGAFYDFNKTEQASTLKACGGNIGGGSENFVIRNTSKVRKLTPTECLRLQGFPDDWFDGVEGYSDTVAYKSIGNSMAVPCMYWIGRRIQMVADILRGKGY